MPTRNVVITAHQESVIEGLVQSGRYRSASEVMRAALQLIETQEAADAAKLAALRAAAHVGIDAIHRGDYREFTYVDAMVAYLNDVGDKVLAEPDSD